jgi:hypothetical protein
MFCALLATLLSPPVLAQHATLISITPEALQPGTTVFEQSLIADALRRRKFRSSEIDSFGVVDSPAALARILNNVTGGILYISGEAKLAEQPRLEFPDGESMAVSKIGEMLKGKSVLLLPDFGYTNLLYSRIPSDVDAIVSTGGWASDRERKRVGNYELDGRPLTRVGVFTVALWRAIPLASDVADLASRVNQHSGTGSMAAMWSDLYRVRVVGSGLPVLPGSPLEPLPAARH